ncbi:hypothetical protein FPOA_11829 [Fusarium poae]|uniref:Uncharacterized protein n=1 Tax=Fusarium poae TaxID=36050 RepID=A0A1B8AHV6_FUSPO|nr:hypothetical protein FPOA_11829 [Fusarium poae]
MSNRIYLPISPFSWPIVRRDGPPEQSKTDKAVTITIVCGISALVLAPLVWYVAARIVTVRRERAAKEASADVEQGQDQASNNNNNNNNHNNNHNKMGCCGSKPEKEFKPKFPREEGAAPRQRNPNVQQYRTRPVHLPRDETRPALSNRDLRYINGRLRRYED